MDRSSVFQTLAEKAKQDEKLLSDISTHNSDIGSTDTTNNSDRLKNGRGISFRNIFGGLNKSDGGNSEQKEAVKTFDRELNDGMRTLNRSITALKAFLEDNRNNYLSISVSLLGNSSTSSVVADLERDKIDEQAENLIKLCNQRLTTLQSDANSAFQLTNRQQHNISNSQKSSESSKIQEYDESLCTFSNILTSSRASNDTPQSSNPNMTLVKLNENHEHRKLVLKMLEVYLKQVCEIYTEQKAVRLKNSVERKQFSRLETTAKTLPSGTKLMSNSVDTIPSVKSSDGSSLGFSSGGLSNDVNDILTAEEQEQLEIENKQLLNELQGMEDDVKLIEGQVVEISRLQNIFTEKILAQSEQIQSVHMAAVSSTENIKQGNEHVRDAIRNNAGLRFWVLFILVVCSFSLLFLDWYDT